ncbi:josephin-2 isoform X1 [Alligator mississippiensis]|uniref:josephin-2 isoform X1 n=1 Tax=Alligator mississippiensis TaxID=8496 RepID=UPI00071187FB|nr:josephin-2 isoform X1 [Alligator mississippiensis]
MHTAPCFSLFCVLLSPPNASLSPAPRGADSMLLLLLSHHGSSPTPSPSLLHQPHIASCSLSGPLTPSTALPYVRVCQCPSPHPEHITETLLSSRLAPDARMNPHRSFLGTGNYDVNVIMAALHSLDFAAVWWDKRKFLEQLVLSQILGFIINVPSNVSLGFMSLPLRRKHWIAVRQVNGTYYNLDSKLKAPACIGGEGELRAFLQDVVSQSPCEVLLVVPRAVEEAGSWLSPE